jgi:tRNA nucleotidyltransferase (CCA-adding enzyme)
MDLILCHITADFDTLGAAVGLSRLRPGSRIVLTGGAHPAVRDFLALHRDEYALIERRSVSPSTIHSVVVVDTQSRDRLGKVAEWLDLPQVRVILYDHHLDTVGDIAATECHIAPVGATTTLVVEQLQASQVTLTPVEATVMALGIHVDTGSLTFDHTTVRDAAALTWLMQQGANLRAIAEYIEPGLSPQLQILLGTALEDLRSQEVHGYTIAWVLLKTESYVPGLSSLASRLIDLTESDGLLLGHQYCRGQCPEGAGNILTVIGRSRMTGTDLNQLFKPLGGGGHARAAALTLREVDVSATLAELLAQLIAQVPHPPTARELMSSPVRTIRPETTIAAAQRILLRYGHSGLSVVNDQDQLVGIISRRDLDIAFHHGFSHAPVKGYMTTNLKTITPTTVLPEIEALMVTYDIGRLPVLQAGQLVGIVTRTDVLRQLHQTSDRGVTDVTRRGTLPLSLGQPGNAECLTDRLASPLPEILAIAAQQAEQNGWQLYLVGGAVRDLHLANPDDTVMLTDIDLVVDGFDRAADVGAGVELARSLQALYPEARLEIHGKFQTAALLWHKDAHLDSLWIDIATARTEFYPYPAANPEVEASSIQQDLYRRDFTINALALRLTQPRRGELLDFFGGVLDLQAQQIRVLHPNSFIEDPTRIYRAVRFAVRLGFTLDAQTEGFIRHAIASGIYAQIQQRQVAGRLVAPALQTRLKAELKYILQAPYWKAALGQLSELGALGCIHPHLVLDPRLWRQLRLTDRVWHGHPQATLPHWQILLEVLIAHLEPPDRIEVAHTLQLSTDGIIRLTQLAEVEAQLRGDLPQCDRPSQVIQQLQAYSLPLLTLVAVRSDRPLRQQIWRYLTVWSQIKPILDGQDLKTLGYKPGRQFKRILADLKAATVDGIVGDRATAKAFLAHRYPRG